MSLELGSVDFNRKLEVVDDQLQYMSEIKSRIFSNFIGRFFIRCFQPGTRREAIIERLNFMVNNKLKEWDKTPASDFQKIKNNLFKFEIKVMKSKDRDDIQEMRQIFRKIDGLVTSKEKIKNAIEDFDVKQEAKNRGKKLAETKVIAPDFLRMLATINEQAKVE